MHPAKNLHISIRKHILPSITSQAFIQHTGDDNIISTPFLPSEKTTDGVNIKQETHINHATKDISSSIRKEAPTLLSRINDLIKIP